MVTDLPQENRESPVPPDIMQRLGFIRYVYMLGLEQSRQAGLLATAAVLSWHDSVELFLHLAAEWHQIELKARERLDFDDYFGRINKQIEPESLRHHLSMRRLNETRVSLKHRGVIPARIAVGHLRSDVRRFFEDNTPVLFGISFEAISMIDMVSYPLARTSLSGALQAIERGDAEAAAIATARGFAQLIVEHKEHAGSSLGRAPFRFVPYFMEPPSFRRRTIPDLEQERFEETLIKSLESIQDVLEILSLGIDYRRYAKFKHYMPTVRHIPNSTRYNVHIVNGILGKPAWPPSLETCRSCFDFVIETAIRLQDLDRYMEISEQ